MRELESLELTKVAGGFGFEDEERRLPTVPVTGTRREVNRPWEARGQTVGQYLFGDNYGLLIGLDVLAANASLDPGISGDLMRAMREEADDTQEEREAENAEEERQAQEEEYQQFLEDAQLYCNAVNDARGIIGLAQIPADELAEILSSIFADGMDAAADGYCEQH